MNKEEYVEQCRQAKQHLDQAIEETGGVLIVPFVVRQKDFAIWLDKAMAGDYRAAAFVTGYRRWYANLQHVGCGMCDTPFGHDEHVTADFVIMLHEGGAMCMAVCAQCRHHDDAALIAAALEQLRRLWPQAFQIARWAISTEEGNA